jgi:hypothetical protein
MGENTPAYGLMVGEPEGKRPLGRPRRRWVDNIKMDLVEIGWGGVGWAGLAQDRWKWRPLVNAVMKFWVHKMLRKYRMTTQLVGYQVVLSSTEIVGMIECST